MSTHTPGPWAIFFEYNVRGPDGRLVAACGGHENNVNSAQVAEENQANARLIAAAPDLLAAVVAAEDALSGAVTEHSRGCAIYKASPCDCWLSDRKRALQMLRDAIAKAEGRGP